jgi:hypothetical protein
MTPTIPSLHDPSVPSIADQETGHSFVLWRDFNPRDRGGVLGLVDDILDRLVQNRMRLHWIRSGVTEVSLDGGEPRTFEFAFRNSIARAVIARIAVLCDDEIKRDPIYPYRGVGSFTDPRWPQVRFDVNFSNTPAEQRLELTPVFVSEHS